MGVLCLPGAGVCLPPSPRGGWVGRGRARGTFPSPPAVACIGFPSIKCGCLYLCSVGWHWYPPPPPSPLGPGMGLSLCAPLPPPAQLPGCQEPTCHAHPRSGPMPPGPGCIPQAGALPSLAYLGSAHLQCLERGQVGARLCPPAGGVLPCPFGWGHVPCQPCPASLWGGPGPGGRAGRLPHPAPGGNLAGPDPPALGGARSRHCPPPTLVVGQGFSTNQRRGSASGSQ